MGKWLSKFYPHTLEDGTDKADIVPSKPTVSGMSGSFPRMLSENSRLSPDGIPASPNLSPLPNSYCRECRGGYWIRQTPEVAYQCGRCSPAGPHCESVYVPGGTPFLTSPIEAGWLVVYQDQTGRLCGGADDRMHGTVQACRREAGKWTVVLTDGLGLPLSKIRSVASTHPDGRISAAWTMRAHGYDGHGPSKG